VAFFFVPSWIRINNAKNRNAFSIPPKKACLLTPKGRQSFSHSSIKHKCHFPGRMLWKISLDIMWQWILTLLPQVRRSNNNKWAEKNWTASLRSILPHSFPPALFSGKFLFYFKTSQKKVLYATRQNSSSAMENNFSPWNIALYILKNQVLVSKCMSVWVNKWLKEYRKTHILLHQWLDELYSLEVCRWLYVANFIVEQPLKATALVDQPREYIWII
jgi:hypothetical protein